MPGAFAHITLVNELRETKRLEAISSKHLQAVPAILKYFKFTELGAVSPDYPYLAVADRDSAEWADLMHYTRTGEMIHKGIELLKVKEGVTREKGLAWLLGYTAHVVTDVTIHPVVELKVGPYAENKKHHRICEMNQDAYIFRRLNLGGVGISEHFESGIWACCEKGKDLLDKDIFQFWNEMLEGVHPQNYNQKRPNVHKWHQSFNFNVNRIAEEGYRLLPLARHVAVDCGLTYPNYEEIDFQYIHQLSVPGGVMDYDEIFDRAINNVGSIWSLVINSVFSETQEYKTRIRNWNLDTGRDLNNQLAFWG